MESAAECAYARHSHGTGLPYLRRNCNGEVRQTSFGHKGG